MDNVYEPIKVQPKIQVTLQVGARTAAPTPGSGFVHRVRPVNKTCTISWHETVFDILERLSEVSDGSLVMLRPGSPYPFQMWDEPYQALTTGTVLSVVPNSPDQVGPTAEASAPIAAVPAPPKLRVPSAEPVAEVPVDPAEPAAAVTEPVGEPVVPPIEAPPLVPTDLVVPEPPPEQTESAVSKT